MPNKSSSKLKQKNNYNYFKVYDTLRTKNLLVIFSKRTAFFESPVK